MKYLKIIFKYLILLLGAIIKFISDLFSTKSNSRKQEEFTKKEIEISKVLIDDNSDVIFNDHGEIGHINQEKIIDEKPIIPSDILISKLIDNVIETEYKVNIKKIDKDLEEEINDFKERTIPKLVNKEIVSVNDLSLKKEIVKLINEEDLSFNNLVNEELIVVDDYDELKVKEDIAINEVINNDIKDVVNNDITIDTEVVVEENLTTEENENVVDNITIKDNIKTELVNDKEEAVEVVEDKGISKALNNFIKYVKQSVTFIKMELTKEASKEDLEYKNYKKIYDKIDAILLDIENKLMIYDKKLSFSQKELLNQEKLRILEIRDSIKKYKGLDIVNEEKKLEEYYNDNVISVIEKELLNLKVDSDDHLSMFNLSNLEQLNKIDYEKARVIERRLVLMRMQKMLDIRSSVLMKLPFLRNNHFLQFSKTLLMDRNIKSLNGILNRVTIKDYSFDFDEVRTGANALENALNHSYNNIEQFDFIVNQLLTKYPEFKYDSQFILYQEIISSNLESQHNSLMRKDQVVKKYCNRNIRKRILKL